MDIKMLIFKGGEVFRQKGWGHQQTLRTCARPSADPAASATSFSRPFSIPQVTFGRTVWVLASEVETRFALSPSSSCTTSQRLVSEFGWFQGLACSFTASGRRSWKKRIIQPLFGLLGGMYGPNT